MKMSLSYQISSSMPYAFVYMRSRYNSTPSPYPFSILANSIDFYLHSEGFFESQNPDNNGIARIEINGKDVSLHKRGFNVAIVDGYTGKMLSENHLAILPELLYLISRGTVS